MTLSYNRIVTTSMAKLYQIHDSNPIGSGMVKNGPSHAISPDMVRRNVDDSAMRYRPSA